MFYLENYELEKGVAPGSSGHLGVGVFETVRGRRRTDGYRVLGFDRHLARLEKGDRYINSGVYDRDRLTRWLNISLRSFANQSEDDCRIRIVLVPGRISLNLEPWFEKHPVAELQCISVERCLPELKSCSSLPSFFSAESARNAGFTEALLVDGSGLVRESSWGNFFWLDDAGNLHTEASRILPGITRSILLSESRFPPVSFSELSRDEIAGRVAGAFITRATDGVLPVRRIDSHTLPAGEQVLEIKQMYESLFDGVSELVTVLG
jgi:branched-subunit amino acid aminotransferase/4-amino-4-deoxychorismate lyase